MVLEHETAAQDTTGRFERAASDAGVPFFVAAPEARRRTPAAPAPAAVAARTSSTSIGRTVAIVLAAVLAGAGVVALELASAHQDARTVWAIFGPAVGW